MFFIWNCHLLFLALLAKYIIIMKVILDLMVLGWILVELTLGTLLIALIWLCIKLRKDEN